MSTSDDLRQLAKAAKAQREAWDAAGQPWPIWNSAMYAMHSALRPEVVLALLEDAERYRWLRSGGERHQPDRNCDGQWLKAGKLVVTDCGYQTWLSELSPDDLDASIDAAMVKETQG